MSYTVFARKYRPQTFDEIVGQQHIVTTLKNAIEQNRLAQAYLFVGPRGTGKTSTARIFAKALNCVNAPTASPCGVCEMCREIAAGNSLNVLEFDAASNTQVDKIRELIIDTVKFAPMRGTYKIYIVDEVHMLSASSFNALLKTLEEPPAHVKFVFATTDVQKVPTTIISRCQRFDLHRIPAPEIAQHLLFIAGKEGITLEPSAAETVARGAEGGLRDAESMLDQLVAFCGETIREQDVLEVFGFTAQQTIGELCEQLIAGDAARALGVIHAQSAAGKDLGRLMSDLIAHLRNLLVLQHDPDGIRDELSSESIAALSEQSARIASDKLLELIEQFAAAEQRMKWAPNKKMHFEIAAIRAIQTLGQATLTEVLDTLSAIRGGAAAPEAKGGAAPVGGARETRPGPAPAPAAARVAEPATPLPARPVKAAVPQVAAPAPGREVIAAAPPQNVPLVAPLPATSEQIAIPILSEESASETAAVPVFHEDEIAEANAAGLSAPTPQPATSGELWPQLVARVRRERPLIAGWVEAGTIVSIEGERAVVAFPPSAALAMESCERPNNRKFLEELVAQIGGRRLVLKFEKREGLVVTSIPSAPTPKLEPPPDPMAAFKDDPLIKKALADFKAEILPA